MALFGGPEAAGQPRRTNNSKTPLTSLTSCSGAKTLVRSFRSISPSWTKTKAMLLVQIRHTHRTEKEHSQRSYCKVNYQMIY